MMIIEETDASRFDVLEATSGLLRSSVPSRRHCRLKVRILDCPRRCGCDQRKLCSQTSWMIRVCTLVLRKSDGHLYPVVTSISSWKHVTVTWNCPRLKVLSAPNTVVSPIGALQQNRLISCNCSSIIYKFWQVFVDFLGWHIAQTGGCLVPPKRVAVWLLLEGLHDLYVVSGVTSVCRRLSKSLSVLYVLLVLDLMDVVWLVFSGRSLFSPRYAAWGSLSRTASLMVWRTAPRLLTYVVVASLLLPCSLSPGCSLVANIHINTSHRVPLPRR